MTINGKNELTNAFNQAVSRFWDAFVSFDGKRECLAAQGRLMDAADAVLFSRDALIGADLTEKDWDAVVNDIADMSHCLTKQGIAMNVTPVQTSTGRMTYRLLNKPRF